MISEQKARECIHLLMKTERLRRKYIENEVKSMGIHRSQHGILMYISRHGGKPCQKDIAEKFEISPAAVAVTIKKLENNGYIQRNSSKDDNRYNELKLTAKGKEIIEKSSEVFKEVDRKTFESFTDEELEQFVAMLEKIKLSFCEGECE